MNIQKKLEKILDNYIKQNKIILSEYENIKNKSFKYNELINLLNSNYNEIINNKDIIFLFLNSIYENNNYHIKFKEIINNNNQNELKIFITNIINDYNELLEAKEYLELELTEAEELKKSAQRVKSSLKYHKLISDSENDIKNIKQILNQLESNKTITNKEELLFINELEFYNEMILSEKDIEEEQIITATMYNEIPNIVNTGFQYFEPIEVSSTKKTKLNIRAIDLFENIKNSSKEEILELLEKYKKYNLEDNEYNYILLKILDEYTEELIELYTLMLDKTIYRDKDSLKEVIDNYYATLDRYMVIQNYYNSETEYTPEENNTVNIDYKSEKKFIFSHSETNITKSRLISDMDDIPYEYYDRVLDLMTKFKNGTIGTKELKALTSHKKFKGHLELRYDQVRIVLKHIKDDIYNVLGVFAKKANNDVTMYGRIINRMIPNVDTNEKLATQLEIAVHTEEELKKLVKEKARKGTR